MADDMTRLHKLLLLVLSTDQRNEAATGLEMLVRALKQQGHDIHWLADRLLGKSSGGFSSGRVSDRYDEGYRDGLKMAKTAHQHGAWAPERNEDPLHWDGPDPKRDEASKMPPQRWAAWLLARRRNQLSAWEQDFCESVAFWQGTPTERQRAVLERIIFKVW